MHYLALCCIAKDEDHYLREWLAYHSLLGVEHFYIYDNCSAVRIRDLLGDFVDGSRVTIRRIEGQKMQLPAYDDCLQSFGARCKWVGFLDIDEFALPLRDNDLRVLLAEFEEYGGLAATWHLFGSSGHLSRPKGLVIKNYTEAFTVQESFQIKCFVQPSRTEQCLNPHHFRYLPGHYCVNEDHFPVSPKLQCTFSPGRRVRVNHYFLKSQQDFEEKLRRGRADTTDTNKAHAMIMFYDGAQKACTKDMEILRFLPGLETTMRKKKLPPPNPLLPVDVPTDALLESALAFNNAGQPAKALACLCHGNPEHEAKADFWTLRALLASTLQEPERSELFIRQALVREASETAHAHLRSLLEKRGRMDLAEGITTILRRYPGYFS